MKIDLGIQENLTIVKHVIDLKLLEDNNEINDDQ